MFGRTLYLACTGSLKVARTQPTAILNLRGVRNYGIGGQMSDQDPDILYRAKKQSLEQEITFAHIPNSPGWDEELATDSEADVKADQDATLPTVEDMQKFTLKRLLHNTEPVPDGPRFGADKTV